MQIIIRVVAAICLCISLEVGAIDIKGQMVEHAPRVLPDLPLYDLNDKELFLETLEGNVIILHFWASWCTQCALEMQTLNRLQKIVRKDPIIIVPVSEDFRNLEKIKEFYKDNHLRYLLSFIDKNRKWFQSLSLNTLPTTLILNGHMEHIATIVGSFNWTSDDNIARIKSFVLSKESSNPDYMNLLDKQGNIPKPPVTEAAKPKKKEIPEEAITNVAPRDMEDIREGDPHINVTNTD